jgi:myo-inositol catabolism protein IolS
VKYTTLPNTDIEVSRVAMGCWALAGDATWGPQDESDAVAGIHAALDEGITLFDTAELYGDGLSEQILGRALAGRRGRAVIASKFGPDHNAPDDLAAACERSLKYLGTDYIDLYQVHWPSRTVPLADTWAALERLRQQGKVRAIGVSNFGPGDLADLLGVGRPASNQVPYNLLMRAVEFRILPACLAQGIGVLCYSPLMVSLLTGKYAAADEVPAGRARTRHFSSSRPETRHGEPGCEAETFAALGGIWQIAAELGRPMSDVALAWLLHRPGVTSVLGGIRNPEQARRNAAAAELMLPDDVLAELDAATEPVKQALGPNPDMWQGASDSRYR